MVVLFNLIVAHPPHRGLVAGLLGCAFEGARIAGWGSIDGSKRRVVRWRGSLVVYLLGIAHFLVCIEGLERRVRGHLHWTGWEKDGGEQSVRGGSFPLFKRRSP